MSDEEEAPYQGNIHAPFTEEQAAALNRYQVAGRMHPFACPREHEGQTDLIARAGAGWVCSDPRCDYTQDWAHAFMLDPVMGTPYAQTHEKPGR